MQKRRDKRTIFEEFQQIGRECRAFRRDDVNTHFWVLMEDHYGADIHDNPFQFDFAEMRNIKNLFKSELEKSKGEAARGIKEETSLVYQFAKVIHDRVPVEGEPFACRLERLETLDGFDQASLLEMQKNVNPINQELAIQIIEIWRGNELVIDKGEEALRMDEILLSKMLKGVDDVLRGSFLECMSSLLDFLVHPSREIELIYEGPAEYEEFFSWVRANKQELAQGRFSDIGRYGDKASLKTFLERFAKTYFLDVERVPKISGKEDGKQIAVLRKKELLNYYKRQKVDISGKSDNEKKRELRRIVIQKKARGERLAKPEEAFYQTIGDRIILKKKDVAPQAVYQRLLDLVIPGDEFEIDQIIASIHEA